jgi:predicted phage gp36 major capsid-like protein
MSFTATQYLFKAQSLTATTTATVGGYTVPAATRFSIVAMTVANSATTNITNYVDVSAYDGSVAYPIVVKMPVYPGGAEIIEGIQKHILPTGGGMYVTAYATAGVSVVMSGIEVT